MYQIISYLQDLLCFVIKRGSRPEIRFWTNKCQANDDDDDDEVKSTGTT